MTFDVSILEYLGRIDDGVLVCLSIIYKDNYFESTFFYTKDGYIFTCSEELESFLNMKIKEHQEYDKLINQIYSKVLPFDEIYHRLNVVNPKKWVS